jgi:hypothetical protein
MRGYELGSCGGNNCKSIVKKVEVGNIESINGTEIRQRITNLSDVTTDHKQLLPWKTKKTNPFL